MVGERERSGAGEGEAMREMEGGGIREIRGWGRTETDFLTKKGFVHRIWRLVLVYNSESCIILFDFNDSCQSDR